MAQCKDILKLLNDMAPFAAAEHWDNSGLLVGSRHQEITKILAAMDLAPRVVEEAVNVGAQMILLHHPVLFTGTKQVTDESAEGRMLMQLISNQICVVAMHTNWDKAKGGVNDALAGLLELTDCVPLIEDPPSLYALSTYVPGEYAQQVIDAVCSAGAGQLGNYQDCVFSVEGEGQFKPLAGAHPFKGDIGETEHVAETKLEWIVEEQYLKAALAALKSAHPYEEPAFTAAALKNDGRQGLGCIGKLKKPVSFDRLCHVLSEKLQTVVKGCGDEAALISRVAVCGGAGGAIAIQNAMKLGADALVSSDFKYHELQSASQNGLCIADPGHGPGEMPGLDSLAAALQKRLDAVQYNVTVQKTDTESGIRFYGRTYVR
ncbi:MAG: Nif3-like dinuclear metal center hexameric protein [Christensenellales bacterium]